MGAGGRRSAARVQAPDFSMTFRYRRIDEEGADLGPLASYRSEWQPGERLSRWHGERLEVVSVVEADELTELFRAYIVVRPR